MKYNKIGMRNGMLLMLDENNKPYPYQVDIEVKQHLDSTPIAGVTFLIDLDDAEG